MDTAVNKYDNQSYIDCRNFRITSLEESKSGALSVIKGNEFKGVFPDASLFVGGDKVRDKLILFSAYTPTHDPGSKAHNGCIWVADLNAPNPFSPLYYVYRGELNMSTENPIIDMVTFYESDKVIKVYFTDGVNNLRYCNIADPLLIGYTPEQLEIVQEINLVQPEFFGITTGSIPVGMVQYCYRLYKNNGHASNFSVPGRMIPITDRSETLSRSNKYGGSDGLNDSGDPKNSGKGVNLTISGLPDNYDRVEVIAIHYKTINGAPDIKIVGVYTISDNLFVTDTGLYNLGGYSLDEFLFINNPFTCKTIATKNNILFAGNIKENEYDISYDARAYRWNQSGPGICRIYEKDGTYWENRNDNVERWVKYTSAGVYITETWGMGGIPQNLDAISRNNIEYNKYQSSTLVEKYQKTPNSGVVGGTGRNVSYSFSGSRRRIDESALTYGVAGKWAWNLWNVSIPRPNYYNGYPGITYNQSDKTWARDEIYRFGAVFFDDKGRPSPVKWIADIRMPGYDRLINPGSGADKSYQFFEDGVYVQANVLRVNFELTNIPSTAKYCQIVYVPREEKDKTCVLQGRVGWFNNASSVYNYANPARLCSVSAYNALSLTHKKFLYLISPEIAFYKRYQKSNLDFLQIIGTNKGFTQGAGGGSIIINNATKFYDLTPAQEDANKWQSIIAADISDYPSPPDELRQEEGFSNYTYKKYLGDPDGAVLRIGDLGTCLLLDIQNSLSTTGLSVSEFMFATVRRNLFGVQYGGNSYQDRTRNVYIPAGPIVSVVGGSASAVASWGDTWISYHDHLTGYYNAAATAKRQYTEMIPVETSVNLSFRHDDCFHTIAEANSQRFFIRETGNAEFTVSGVTYTPGWSDYYVYNTVYSRLSDCVKYYPSPIDYDPESNDDTLVKASAMKLGREAIDPWTSFGFAENIHLDNAYGPVNRLVSWKNNLFALQEDAVAVLSVMDRSLIQDNNEGALSLGEGGVLSRYDYLTTNLGLSTRNSVITTEIGFYWYDNKRRRFNRFRGGVEDLGSVKGVNSYLNGIPKECGVEDNTYNYSFNVIPVTGGKGFLMCQNSPYQEVWFTVKHAFDSGDTLIYNEILDSFIGFMDTKAMGQIAVDDKILSAYYTNLYYENEGTFGSYYGTYYNSHVTMVVNPMPNIPVTFTNYEITSEVWDGNTQVHNKTISSIRTQNDYQDTGVLTLNNTNSRRLIRTWRLDAKRNSSDSARLRDTYAKVTMSFVNNANNYNLVLHDLVTLYMVPAESVASKFSQQK